ncbi:hypothetical protein [Sediminibacillus halophilus]|uniref:Transglycosylase n=1 Tax=Sediminibacillus halophilus TaxID=482461 RepID=A0A1G9QVT8_9BACI|nr:hypothetical protein [Sediminibacillus halophilus]SDM14970.1 hypothetical protein SAMN05216244_1685 [Sediminibacillus halophilus]
MIVNCDVCEREFEVKELKQETMEQDIHRYYVECPNQDCQAEYTSYYSDPEIRKLQQEIRTLSEKHPLKAKQKDKVLKLRKKVQHKADLLKEEMHRGN